METIFSKLHNAITKMASQAGLVKKNTVKKKDLYASIDLTSQRLKSFTGGFEVMSDADKRALADRIYAMKTKSDAQACAAYINLAAQTRSRTDSSSAFSSIIIAAKAIANVLNNFLANIDLIFEGANDINIHTAKLSHVAMFGFIEKAEMYSNYIVALLYCISYEVSAHNGTHELDKPKPYKYSLINDKYEEFKTFHDQMMHGGRESYLNTFKSLIKSVDNIRVANSDTGSNLNMIDDSQLQGYSRGFLYQYSLNPFKWIGEQWNLIRDYIYKKREAEREAILTHINFLTAEMNGKDPNSEEYQKYVKVIAAYNEMVAKLDQKINAYYNE